MSSNNNSSDNQASGGQIPQVHDRTAKKLAWISDRAMVMFLNFALDKCYPLEAELRVVRNENISLLLVKDDNVDYVVDLYLDGVRQERIQVEFMMKSVTHYAGKMFDYRSALAFPRGEDGNDREYPRQLVVSLGDYPSQGDEISCDVWTPGLGRTEKYGVAVCNILRYPFDVVKYFVPGMPFQLRRLLPAFKKSKATKENMEKLRWMLSELGDAVEENVRMKILTADEGELTKEVISWYAEDQLGQYIGGKEGDVSNMALAAIGYRTVAFLDRISSLQDEVNLNKNLVRQQNAMILKQGATIQEQSDRLQEQGATIQEQGATIQEQGAAIEQLRQQLLLNGIAPVL